MIISVDAEIVFNKIQFPFVTNSQHPRNRKELLHSDKGQLQKPIANSKLNSIRIFPFRNQGQTSISKPITCIQHYTGDPRMGNK